MTIVQKCIIRTVYDRVHIWKNLIVYQLCCIDVSAYLCTCVSAKVYAVYQSQCSGVLAWLMYQTVYICITRMGYINEQMNWCTGVYMYLCIDLNYVSDFQYMLGCIIDERMNWCYGVYMYLCIDSNYVSYCQSMYQ